MHAQVFFPLGLGLGLALGVRVRVHTRICAHQNRDFARQMKISILYIF